MPIRFSNKPGLVVYLTVGDPDLATTREIALAAIDAGADVLELGVPFSDPLADGPVIQRASERAVANGTTLNHVLALASDLRAARPQTGLVIFSYLNPILRYGLERFTNHAKAAGVDGVLATDLTIEEAEGHYLKAMRAANLAPIFLAAPPARTTASAASRLSARALFTPSPGSASPARGRRSPPMRARSSNVCAAIHNYPSSLASASPMQPMSPHSVNLPMPPRSAAPSSG